MIPATIGVTTYQGKNEKGYQYSRCPACIHRFIVHGWGGADFNSFQPPSGKINCHWWIAWTGSYLQVEVILQSIVLVELPHPRVNDVDPERDSIEFSLLSALIKTGKPFLGICRGFQVD